MLKVIAFAALAAVLRCASAGEGGEHPAPQPSPSAPSAPDDWSNWKLHASVSAGIGLGLYAAFPQANKVLLGAACMIPGYVDEMRDRRRPGGRFSHKDLYADLAGCTGGIAVAHGVRVYFAPNWVGIGWVLQ